MITKITLKNFKCFEDESVPLAPLNLWTGLNGMGKSTFIQALLLLRQNHELGLLQRGEAISLNGNMVHLGNAKDVLYQYYQNQEITVELHEEVGRAAWRWDAAGGESDFLPLLDKDGDIDACLKTSLFTSKFHYMNAERLGPRVYFETSNYHVTRRQELGAQGEFAANYLAEYGNKSITMETLKHPGATGSTLLEQVDAWLGEIKPGTKIEVSSNLDMSLVGLKYQFVGGRDRGNLFRPTNVGFGLSFLLPVLVAILSSQPDTLLILENPEAHLHPRGQAEIGRLLALAAAGGIQVIAETHSDHILNGVRVAVKKGMLQPEKTRLLFFDADVVEDQIKHLVSNPKIDENGRISHWPEGFFDEWERQLGELI